MRLERGQDEAQRTLGAEGRAPVRSVFMEASGGCGQRGGEASCVTHRAGGTAQPPGLLIIPNGAFDFLSFGHTVSEDLLSRGNPHPKPASIGEAKTTET